MSPVAGPSRLHTLWGYVNPARLSSAPSDGSHLLCPIKCPHKDRARIRGGGSGESRFVRPENADSDDGEPPMVMPPVTTAL